MATPERTGGGSLGGIGLGGILVIIGILLAIFWSVWVGSSSPSSDWSRSVGLPADAGTEKGG